MAINATTNWYIRAGGNELNGGGYDSAISGAVTNYCDQDAAQLSLSDLVCVDSTTLTSVTGGFTAAMIGNAIRISAGTNFIPGYYFVTARTNTNTVTLDRKPVTGGTTGALGVGRVGGAFATIVNVVAAGSGSGPAVTSPLIAGNIVYVRGAGSSNPSSTDYDYSAGYYNASVNGDATNGKIRFIGYNGRPLLLTAGLLINTPDLYSVENIKFKYAASAAYAAYAVLYNSGKSDFIDCIFDANGNDASPVRNNGLIKNNYFYNTGGGGAGSYAAITAGTYGVRIRGNVIDGWLGPGIDLQSFGMASVESNVVRNCLAEGIVVGGLAYGAEVSNNTIDANGSDGVSVTQSGLHNLTLFNNIISNHTVSGKKGIKISAGTAAENDRIASNNLDYNAFYNNSAHRSGISAGAHDTDGVDPQYTNSGSGDYSIGTNLKALGFPGAFPDGTTTGYLDLGAAQRQEAGGGGVNTKITIGASLRAQI